MGTKKHNSHISDPSARGGGGTWKWKELAPGVDLLANY